MKSLTKILFTIGIITLAGCKRETETPTRENTYRYSAEFDDTKEGRVDIADLNKNGKVDAIISRTDNDIFFAVKKELGFNPLGKTQEMNPEVYEAANLYLQAANSLRYAMARQRYAARTNNVQKVNLGKQELDSSLYKELGVNQ
ncbi:MAG: hypothetical protein WCI72_01050 [archaeon]